MFTAGVSGFFGGSSLPDYGGLVGFPDSLLPLFGSEGFPSEFFGGSSEPV
jgi:hypothetical protein